MKPNMRVLAAHWINERETIRLKKERGLTRPWTKDPILSTYRFCNVHREDDKVTRWIAANWRQYVDSPNFMAAMVLARTINWPPTLQTIGFPHEWNTEEIVVGIQKCHKLGKAWGNAYIVSTNGVAINKALYVVMDVCAPLVAPPLPWPGKCSLKALYTRLRGFRGLGSFMAGQVVADLKNTQGSCCYKASDWWTWATLGPGSLRGLTEYHGMRVTKASFMVALEDMSVEVAPLVAPWVGDMCMQDWQNVMCEFHKYMKVKNGTGRPKATYHPAPDF